VAVAVVIKVLTGVGRVAALVVLAGAVQVQRHLQTECLV
jgi:hypothetical protein